LPRVHDDFESCWWGMGECVPSIPLLDPPRLLHVKFVVIIR